MRPPSNHFSIGIHNWLGTDDSGLPALAVAVYHRKPDIVALLESHGAAMDIFSAAMAGRRALVGELLTTSPDP